jgi:hypothetical protein
METIDQKSMKSFLESIINRLPEDKKVRFGEYLRNRQRLIHTLGKLNPNEWEWHAYKTKSGEDTWKI